VRRCWPLALVASMCLVAPPSTTFAALTTLGMTNKVAQVLPTATPASSFVPLTQPTPNLGPPILVDDLVAQAREWDNKPVQATGTAQDVRSDATPRGPVLQFDLCGHRCIHILDASNPTVADGATTTIKGIFHQHFSLGRFSADDIIIIAPGGLPQDRSHDWRRSLEQGPYATPRP
jgi:hypothetical protein